MIDKLLATKTSVEHTNSNSKTIQNYFRPTLELIVSNSLIKTTPKGRKRKKIKKLNPNE